MSAAAFPLIGHAEPEARFLKARHSGRLHHAWILQGPSGIGKSIFAKRVAALMLGADALDASAEDPVMRHVLSQAHPDLIWISRQNNEKGQLRQDITVDQIRSLNQFFALKPALSGWRVGVIDALDDMNVSGLNALLKTLEEPPANAILLLISQLEKPVLPTIRSRCQSLRFLPLSAEETKSVLAVHPDQAALAADLANGRPGYGLSLATPRAATAAKTAQQIIESINKSNAGPLAANLASTIVDESSLQAFCDRILEWTAEKALNQPVLARTWLHMSRQQADSKALNLTPLQTAAKLVKTLQNDLQTLPS